MSLFEKLKAGLALAFFAVCFVLFFFFSEPAPKPYWMNPEAKAFVTQSLKDFCTELYGDGACPNTKITGKQVWLAISVLGASGITTKQAETILVSQGWHKLSTESERMTSFCKSGHVARYEHAAGFVDTISFKSGSHTCEKLARKP